jgi:hypothetical protein
MKYRLLAFLIVLLASNIYGRDVGYALECIGVESMQKQVVGFLETEVDKIVNLSEVESRTFWDSHKWLEDTIMVRSFMQLKDNAEPTETLSIKIKIESLKAVLIHMGNADILVHMQCQNWGPKGRNK